MKFGEIATEKQGFVHFWRSRMTYYLADNCIETEFSSPCLGLMKLLFLLYIAPLEGSSTM